MTPSMEEAAQIRDVAARHAYVFDNGLCSPDFFDVEKRMASEEFTLLTKHCDPTHRIFEAGCLTGLNLLGLASLGYKHLAGIDFVDGAIGWLKSQAAERGLGITADCMPFSAIPRSLKADRAICFDVLEHQLNVGQFLEGVRNLLTLDGGQALFLIPEGRHFFDGGHVAFFPDLQCLRNTLDYYFDVVEMARLESCPKLFAVCQRRD